MLSHDLPHLFCPKLIDTFIQVFQIMKWGWIIKFTHLFLQEMFVQHLLCAPGTFLDTGTEQRRQSPPFCSMICLRLHG